MEIRNIEESALSEYIFLNYPDTMSLDNCIERLELEIYDWSMKNERREMIEEVEDDGHGNLRYTGNSFDANEPTISPYYLFMLERAKNKNGK